MNVDEFEVFCIFYDIFDNNREERYHVIYPKTVTSGNTTLTSW